MSNKFALKHILAGKDKGVVMALGYLHQFKNDVDKTPTKYAVIKTYKDRKIEAWYDYGKDVILSNDLMVGQLCTLIQRENGQVEWVLTKQPTLSMPEEEEVIPEHIITAEQVYKERGKSAEILQNESLAKKFSRKITKIIRKPAEIL